MSRRDILVAIAGLVLGAALWLGWVVWFGDREAWDNTPYLVATPIAAFLAGAALAVWRPGLGVVFAFAFVVGHVITGLATMGFGNMWPFTVVFLGLFASPSLVGAAVVYIVWRKRQRRAADDAE